MNNNLDFYIEKYKTDKALSGYSKYYEYLFSRIRHDVKSVLEIGIGSLDQNIKGNFRQIIEAYNFDYSPGGSLRAWRDYFTNANIIGVDIGEDCKFSEERIETLIFNSTDYTLCEENLKDKKFDIIIDDGSHQPSSQLYTLRNLFNRVNENGFYIIEDLGGTGDGRNLFIDNKELVLDIIKGHEYFFVSNILIVRKNNSNRNSLKHVEDFYMEDKKEYEKIFSGIYENYGFGSLESRSGPGSTLSETEYIREEIKSLIQDKGIKSIVDIPCGDFNWIKEIVFNFESYIGGDIVKECVDANNKKYANSVIKFIHFDLLENEIPEGDLLLVRDVIGHFPIEDGLKIVNNILNSKCKYLLSTTWYNKNTKEYYKSHYNENISYGRFYAVNLMSQPFNFPEPDHIIEETTVVDEYESGVRKVLGFWEIDKIREHIKNIKVNYEPAKKYDNSLTIVSGLWQIGKSNRPFDHYLMCFEKFLEIDQNMFLFIPKELEEFVWSKRSRKNTKIKIFELEDIRKLFDPFWDRVQKIRTSEEWLQQANWIIDSPQASLEWYNPIVMSKMSLLHDAMIYNPFNTENLIWLDAGISNTIDYRLLIDSDFFIKIEKYLSPFLFIQYPYPYYGKGVKEIHGFEWEALNKLSGGVTEWISRGGLFGGKKGAISEANSYYWHLLNNTLDKKLMGTEESLFSILAKKYPYLFRTSRININGHVQEFVEKVLNDTAELEALPENKINIRNNYVDTNNLKMSLYMLTFNFPHQVEHTIQKWLKHPKWITNTRNILIDNSTNEDSRIANAEICKKYNFEHIITNENTGINGGRFRAAKHFNESDSDYYIF